MLCLEGTIWPWKWCVRERGRAITYTLWLWCEVLVRGPSFSEKWENIGVKSFEVRVVAGAIRTRRRREGQMG